MDPGDEPQSPIARIQSNDAWAQPIEAHGPGEQGLGEGGIMAVGGGEEEEQGQARAAAEQGVDAIPSQEGAGMMVRRMPERGIRVAAPPSQNRGAIDDQVAPADEVPMQRHSDEDD